MSHPPHEHTSRKSRRKRPPREQLPDSASGWISIGLASISWAIMLCSMAIAIMMSFREEVLAVFSAMMSLVLFIGMCVAAVGCVAGISGLFQTGRRRTSSTVGLILNVIALVGSFIMSVLLMGYYKSLFLAG